MQLVAYGAQDIYLTGNPQITFFKVVYRRHTNFSMESIEQTFNGSANFGSKLTCPISRNGDLIHRIYLQASVNGDTQLKSWAGHKLIKSVEIEIGGQKIDRHYGEWLHIWNELTQTSSKWDGYKMMVNGYGKDTQSDKFMYVPLQFWFCRNPGLALPLIALQYHEVKIILDLAPAAEVAAANTTLNTCSLFVDYIYLDTDERRRFAQVSHEYLIEQLQFTGDESVSSKVKLNFNHPVKELVWVEKTDASAVGEFTTSYDTAKLQLNGHERFSARPYSYFQLVQPFQHHERVPVKMLPAEKTEVAAPTWDSTGVDFSDPKAMGQFLGGFTVDLDGLSLVATDEFDTFNELHGETNVADGTTWSSTYYDLFATAANVADGEDAFVALFNALPATWKNAVKVSKTTPATSKGGDINVYSFALKPEEHQPSGTCNMSRIDNATLNLANATSTNTLKVFAVNYNVLRIMSGMGGLAYSN
jgi:hypothetical protein